MDKKARTARRMSEYTHDSRHPEVPTPWLRDEVGKLRAEHFNVKPQIDNHTWRNWRSQVKIPAGAKYCTQQQAVQIVTIAFWKPGNEPYLKEFLDSPLSTQQLDDGESSKAFNGWIDFNGAKEAASLLEEIFSLRQNLTGAELSLLSKAITGKMIPVSNISRAIGEKIQRDRPCSRAVTRKAIAWMVELRLKREKQKRYQQKSASVPLSFLTAS